MSKTSIHDMDVIEANNTDINGVSVAEGFSPKNINNAIRSQASILKQKSLDEDGTLSLVGTDALTLTANQTITTAYIDGIRMRAFAAADNTGAVTLNVNAKGAKSVKKNIAGIETVLAPGDIKSGALYEFVYSSSIASGSGGWWLIDLNPLAPVFGVDLTSAKTQLFGTGIVTISTDWVASNANLGDAVLAGGVLTIGPNTAGIWVISCQNYFVGTTNSQAYTFKNGAQYQYSTIAAENPMISSIIRVASGDTLSLGGWQNSGGSVANQTSSGTAGFGSMYRISA